ncbi:unnamed protein product, partial [Staurois parvus]
TGLHSVSSTPLCQSLHWPPFSVLHPSLPIPPLASTQCPPSLSANPSTGLHSLASTLLCQSLHWPPFSVLHPSLPIPQLTSIQCPPPLPANPSTGLHSPRNNIQNTTTYEDIHNSASNYITILVSNINLIVLFIPPKTFCSLAPLSPPPTLVSRTSPEPLP